MGLSSWGILSSSRPTASNVTVWQQIVIAITTSSIVRFAKSSAHLYYLSFFYALLIAASSLTTYCMYIVQTGHAGLRHSTVGRKLATGHIFENTTRFLLPLPLHLSTSALYSLDRLHHNGVKAKRKIYRSAHLRINSYRRKGIRGYQYDKQQQHIQRLVHSSTILK